MPITNEQSQRFKDAILCAYRVGVEDGRVYMAGRDPDNKELSKLVWWALNGTSSGRFTHEATGDAIKGTKSIRDRLRAFVSRHRHYQ